MIDRARVYAGALLRLSATDATRALVAEVRDLVARELGAPIESAEQRLAADEHRAAVDRARAAMAARVDVRPLVRELGFDQASAVDRLRLRAVRSGAHREPGAAPAYYAHRDTWYANPRAQINVWIPLHDVRREDTLVVYEEAFGVHVDNDSRAFDWEAFSRRVGWQRRDAPADAVYPRALVDLDRFAPTYVEARAAEVVVFAGAHLHRTQPHDGGRTRFSVDFRVVDLADHEARLGAPCVDDASRGSALEQYESVA